jgi:hypothetical protein
VRFEFESRTVYLFYLFPLFHLENRVCLSHGVQVTMIMAGVGDLMQRTKDGRTGQVLSDWAIERSGDIVCDLHRARGDEKHRFLG